MICYTLTGQQTGEKLKKGLEKEGNIVSLGCVPTPEGKIVKQNNNVAIDCGCGKGGQLGIYCLNNGKEMYV